jgi:8-oxo-dGTP diphosphatase
MNTFDSTIKIYEQKPIGFAPDVEVSAAYVKIDGKTLFLQRSGSERGSWGVPAGKVEKDESPEQALIRELYEETKVRLTDPTQIINAGKLYMQKPHVSYVYHLFCISLEETPNVFLSAEHINYGWYTSEELKKLPLMAGALEAYNHLKLLKGLYDFDLYNTF